MQQRFDLSTLADAIYDGHAQAPLASNAVCALISEKLRMRTRIARK